MTVANQNVVVIHKPQLKKNFLQVDNMDWQTAFKELSPATFGMYLYLTNNADGFNLELSKVAIENAIGIKKSAYYKGIKELVDKGYLVKSQDKKNFYDFFPHLRKENSTNEDKFSTIEEKLSTKAVQKYINIETQNNTYKEALDVPKGHHKSSYETVPEVAEMKPEPQFIF